MEIYKLSFQDTFLCTLTVDTVTGNIVNPCDIAKYSSAMRSFISSCLAD